MEGSVKGKAKTVHVAGKRKRSVARATISSGKGAVRINSKLLSCFTPKYARMKIQEALAIAAGHVDLKKLSIKVKVSGGGVMGQADAVVCAVSRGLIEYSGSDELHARYVSVDRTMIAGDSRQTETHKPGQSSKGPRHKRQKSYR